MKRHWGAASLLFALSCASVLGFDEAPRVPIATDAALADGSVTGGDGQANPNGWRRLSAPTFSFAARVGAQVTWTGSEVLIWQGEDASTGALLFDGAAYNPQSDTWRALPTNPRIVRRGETAVFAGERWFLFGGYTSTPGNKNYLQDLIEFDTRKAVWNGAQSAGPLSARAFASAVAGPSERRAVLWGGDDGPATLGPGALYDADTQSWSAIAEAPISAERVTTLSGYAAGRAYFFGGRGCTSAFLAPQDCIDAAAFDLKDKTWSSLPNLPTAASNRSGMNLTACGPAAEQFYMMAGENDQGRFLSPPQAPVPQRDGTVFDTTTSTYKSVPAPSAGGRALTGNHAVGFCMNGKLGMWGGDTDGSTKFLAPAVYDQGAGTWMALEDAPMTARSNAMVLTVGQDLFVFGGKADGAAESGLAAYAYRFATSK